MKVASWRLYVLIMIWIALLDLNCTIKRYIESNKTEQSAPPKTEKG